MASRMGVSLRAYQNYEAQEREPKAKDVARLARIGIDLNWLLTGEGEMLRPDASADARLDEIEGALIGEEVPITPEIRRHRPALDALHQELLHFARRPDIGGGAARADLLLKIAFGDLAAAERAEQRLDDVGDRLRTSAEAFRRVVHEVGWEPGRHVAMLLRDLMFLYGVSEEDIANLLAAMKAEAEGEAG